MDFYHVRTKNTPYIMIGETLPDGSSWWLYAPNRRVVVFASANEYGANDRWERHFGNPDVLLPASFTPESLAGRRLYCRTPRSAIEERTVTSSVRDVRPLPLDEVVRILERSLLKI